jgi:hypothetical protein
MIKSMKCFFCYCFGGIMYKPCYVSCDEKGIEGVAGKTGQDTRRYTYVKYSILISEK